MRRKWLKLSLVTLIVALGVFVLNYFFFHFVTDEGISLVWHPEAGKPFVANMISVFGVLFLFTSALSFIGAQIFYPRDKNGK